MRGEWKGRGSTRRKEKNLNPSVVEMHVTLKPTSTNRAKSRLIGKGEESSEINTNFIPIQMLSSVCFWS